MPLSTPNAGGFELNDASVWSHGECGDGEINSILERHSLFSRRCRIRSHEHIGWPIYFAFNGLQIIPNSPVCRRARLASCLVAVGERPTFLDGVVRLAQRAVHPIGHRPQVGPVGFEPLCQPFVIVHRHISSLRYVIVVTSETQPM